MASLDGRDRPKERKESVDRREKEYVRRMPSHGPSHPPEVRQVAPPRGGSSLCRRVASGDDYRLEGQRKVRVTRGFGVDEQDVLVPVVAIGQRLQQASGIAPIAAPVEPASSIHPYPHARLLTVKWRLDRTVPCLRRSRVTGLGRSRVEESAGRTISSSPMRRRVVVRSSTRSCTSSNPFRGGAFW